MVREKVRVMNDTTLKVNVETEGFDEAMQQVDALCDAYDGFPAQVMIKHCRDCTINIYPSQIKNTSTDRGKNDETN